MTHLEYTWYTQEVKELSEKIWFPIRENLVQVFESKFNSQHVSSWEDLNNKFEFSEFNLNDERKIELDKLKKDFDFLNLVNQEKLKFLENQNKYIKKIDKYIKKHEKSTDEEIINTIKLYNKMKKEIKKITDRMEQKETNIETEIKKVNTNSKSRQTTFNKNALLANNCKRSLKINLSFNKKQQKILRRWFKYCKIIYDKCVKKFNFYNDIFPEHIGNPDYFPADHIKLKNMILKELFEFDGIKKYGPIDVFSYEVKTFLENLSSCETNLENGHIKKYNIGLKKVKRKQTITIPHKNISKNGIFPNIIRKTKLEWNKIERI